MSRKSRSRFLSSLLLCALADGAIAQTTWYAPSGTDLTSLFAQAAPGDVVVLNGTYIGFQLTKGLVVIGNGSSIIGFGLPATWTVGITVPAGQQARFHGVTFFATPGYHPYFGSPAMLAMPVRVNGNATFEACNFSSIGFLLSSSNTSLVVEGGTVVLNECSTRAVGVLGGAVSMTRCSVRGDDAWAAGTYPGVPVHVQAGQAGLTQLGGTVLVSNCTLTGGQSVPVWWSPPPAKEGFISFGGTAVLTDSTIVGGGYPSSLVGTAQTRFARCSLSGNPPSSGPVASVPQLIGIRMDQGLQLGQTSSVTAIAGSDQLLGIVVCFDAATYVLPPFAEPLFGDPGKMDFVLFAAPGGAGDPVTAPITVPNNLRLRGFPVLLQALQLDGAIVRASAAVGGMIR